MFKRINRACKYSPCHNRLEDCTFCWCPFYPCLNEDLGNFIHSKRLGKNIWSCQECSWIHRKRVVDHIFKMIKQESSQQPAFVNSINSINSMNSKTGVIVLSHGSRLEKANGRVRDIIEKVKKRTNLKYIEPAHLQLSGPTLQKSIKKLASKACKRIIIIPFFLLSGNHVKRDIPKLLEKEKLKYPNIQLIYTEDLGSDQRICEIVVERIQNVCTY